MFIKFEGNIINTDQIEFIDSDITIFTIHFKSRTAIEVEFKSNSEMIDNFNILYSKILICK